MPRVCLLGASGFTGRLIAAELARRGVSFRAAGRSPDRISRALSSVDAGRWCESVDRADVAEPATVRAALDGVDVAISTVGPYVDLGPPIIDAAIDAGCDLVDVSGEQRYARWVYEERGAQAVHRGVTLVPGAGMTGAIGTVLGAVAASVAGASCDVHVAYLLRSPRPLGAATGGTRRTLARMLDEPGWAYRAGELHEERLGEARRLAWFPRPVGPTHAAAIPGLEAIALPHYASDLASVHTYLAMSSWRAELLQAAGAALQHDAVRRRAASWLERDREDPDEASRRRARWACVAEAQGDAGVARAWAYGHDVYGLAAATSVEVALHVGESEPGARPAPAVRDPAALLDELAVATDLRWSLVRPDAGR